MTLAKRVATIETALSPTELVLRWLEQAHAFGGLEAYVRALLEEGASVTPLDRLCDAARQGVRGSLRGKRQEIVAKAIRSALRETVFRIELVCRIEVTTHDLVERELLIDGALSAHLALLANEDRRRRRADETYARRLTSLRDVVGGRVRELHAAQQARSIAEARYLDGHGALFPDTDRAWREQLETAEAIAAVARGLAELHGAPPEDQVDPDAMSGRVGRLVDHLVEPAKSTALERLGEGQQALSIATGWVRAKMGVAGARTALY